MDEVLKQRILGGDLDAYGEVVREHQQMLFGYALRRLGDYRQAEEVVQLTFIRTYQKLDEFRPEQEFGVWLCVTCKYLIMTELEKRRREVRNHENYRGALEVEIGTAMVDTEADSNHDQLAALRLCMERLQNETAALVDLRYFKKKSCKEIASEKNRSVTWVTSNLSRVRKVLRECMENQSGEGALS